MSMRLRVPSSSAAARRWPPRAVEENATAYGGVASKPSARTNWYCGQERGVRRGEDGAENGRDTHQSGAGQGVNRPGQSQPNANDAHVRGTSSSKKTYTSEPTTMTRSPHARRRPRGNAATAAANATATTTTTPKHGGQDMPRPTPPMQRSPHSPPHAFKGVELSSPPTADAPVLQARHASRPAGRPRSSGRYPCTGCARGGRRAQCLVDGRTSWQRGGRSVVRDRRAKERSSDQVKGGMLGRRVVSTPRTGKA